MTTIHGSQYGISLYNNFNRTNPVTIASDGRVSYPGPAVYGQNFAWTIANFGTVDGFSQYGEGVVLLAGGRIDNHGLIEGSGGIYIYNSGTITNESTIAATGAYAGIALNHGFGVVANSSAGLIQGYYDAIDIYNGSGAVTNSGTIAGTVYDGVYLGSGGAVTNNAGLISGGVAGVAIYGSGAVTNAGTISGYNGIYVGNTVTAGVTVENGGTIVGTGGVVIQFAGGDDRLVVDPGAVFAGTVDGAGGDNMLELAAKPGIGTLSGIGSSFVNFDAVVVDAGGAWVLSGYNATGSGTVLSDLGALTNTGTIAGAVTMASGTDLTNAAGAVIAGGGAGVYGLGGDRITNGGTISGAGGTALQLDGDNNLLTLDPGAVFGGTVIASGGNNGLELAPGMTTGTLSGLGTSVAGFAALTIDAGASWYFAGGAAIYGGAVVNNGAALGQVQLAAGVTVYNNYGATLTATYPAILAFGADHIVNSGAIGGGGVAMLLTGGGNAVSVEPGATFAGRVIAQGGGNYLELTPGYGSVTGLGSKFVGFGNVLVDPGAVWRLSGSNADGARFVNDGKLIIPAGHSLVFGGILEDAGDSGRTALGSNSLAEVKGAVAADQRLVFAGGSATIELEQPLRFNATIAGFAAGDAIDLLGQPATDLVYAGGVLTVGDNGQTVADLRIAGSHNATDFTLSPDGNGGSDITLAIGVASERPPPATSDPTAAFWSMRGS